MVEIEGFALPRYAAVKDAFAANFASGEELGARFTLVEAGEVVADLMAGFADRRRSIPFGPETIAPIFSTTKALGALMIARLADQGRLDYGQTVAGLWPEFGQAASKASPSSRRSRTRRGWPAFPSPWTPRSGPTGTPSAPGWRPWLLCGRRGAPAATTR
jgi:CubicO group peptidase (beta-lactamase class C family)